MLDDYPVINFYLWANNSSLVYRLDDLPHRAKLIHITNAQAGLADPAAKGDPTARAARDATPWAYMPGESAFMLGSPDAFIRVPSELAAEGPDATRSIAAKYAEPAGANYGCDCCGGGAEARVGDEDVS